MQTTSTQFAGLAQNDVRPLNWQLRIAFDKTFDPAATFFTLDTSLLDGPDILAPSDNNVIAEWDLFAYTDYSDRVISMEVSREELEPFSIVFSTADIVLNNYDNYFTPNSGSPIDSYIIPGRPFRVLMGFGGEVVQVFVGLSEKVPEIDRQGRTATFHLVDFLSFMLSQKVDNSAILVDYSTSEILDYLFTQLGLVTGQYILDDSFNRIPFFSVNKGDDMGTVVKGLMEAEQGRLYMDELGVIRFLNRQNYPTTPVYTFDKSNTSDYRTSGQDDIINYVKIEADILAVQVEQSIWEQSQPTYVPAGATVDVWANLEYPATSVTTPTYSATPVESSHFISTKDSSGADPYTSITLNSITSFGTAVKMVFENTGSTNAYVYQIDLWGTPVKVVDTIFVEDFDQTSIDAYGQQAYTFTTNYIQDRDSAVSKAAILIRDYKDIGVIVGLDVKGTPALQIGDLLNLDIEGYQGNHVTTKIVNGMSDGRYWQRLVAKFKVPTTYFILDQSLLDGTDDVLAP